MTNYMYICSEKYSGIILFQIFVKFPVKATSEEYEGVCVIWNKHGKCIHFEWQIFSRNDPKPSKLEVNQSRPFILEIQVSPPSYTGSNSVQLRPEYYSI